jgi:hypothetical protein
VSVAALPALELERSALASKIAAFAAGVGAVVRVSERSREAER